MNWILGCGLFQKDRGYDGFGLKSMSKKELAQHGARQNFDEQWRKSELFQQLRTDVEHSQIENLHLFGQEFIYETDESGQRQIWRWKQGELPRQITRGSSQSTIVSVDERRKWLLYLQDQNGQENLVLRAQHLVDGRDVLLFGLEKVRVRPFIWDAEGKSFYFAANDKGVRSNSIYRFEADTEKVHFVFSLPEGETWSVHGARGDQLLLRQAKSSLEMAYFRLDTLRGELIPLFGQKESHRHFALFDSGSRGLDLLVATDRDTEHVGLYRWSEASQKFSPVLEDPQASVDSFQLSPSGNWLVVNWLKQGVTRGVLYRYPSLKPISVPVPHLTDLNSFLLQFKSPFNEDVFVRHLRPLRGEAHWVFDAKKKQFLSGVSRLRLERDLPDVEILEESYLSESEQLRIPMFIKSPKGCKTSKNCPVVVIYHGGPEAHSYPRDSTLALTLLRQGYVVAYPNVRGSSGYGKSWVDADNREKRLQVLTDIKDASIHFREKWALKGSPPRKMIALGGSYGGYSAFVAGTRFAESFDGAVPIVGITDLLSFLKNTAEYRAHLRVQEYGDPESQKDVLESLSPLKDTDKAKFPWLIVHGAEDPRVPVGEALQFHRALIKNPLAKNSKLVVFEDEGHGITKKENQAMMLYWIHTYISERVGSLSPGS